MPAKRRPSGPTQTAADRYAKGERNVMVWLSADYLRKLDAIAAIAGNRRKAVEWLLDQASSKRRKP